jgi:hypothetical protein
MKKLMIAAAGAVMIGGVQAFDIADVNPGDLVYDFSATLTTTTGKEGKSWSETFKVNLGKDGAGKWWYDDDIFVTSADGKFKSVTLASGTYEKALKAGSKQYPWKLNTSVIKSDELKEELADALGFDEVTEDTKYNVQQQYKGKWVWCETFKYKVTYPGECYRVKGTQKIKATVFIDDMCDDGGIVEDNGDAYDFTLQFLNFFGSQDVTKANSVEALYTYDIDDSGNGNLDGADGTNFGFALAGQGTWKAKLFTVKKDGLTWDFSGINSISGNIVGYLPAPDCEACCANAAPALAFTCGEERTQEDNAAWDLPTAAFGTWSMKFNKKATIALLQQ